MTEQESIEKLLAAGTTEAATRLRDLAETTTDKETRKAARRALYRLSLAGVVPEERAPETRPAEPAVTAPDTLRAFASAYDGAGNRLLILLLPDPDGGSPTLAQILTNDEEGIKDFAARRMSRREVAEALERFEKQLDGGLAIAEIESDYARHLLQEARAVNQRLGHATPEGFLDWYLRVGTPHEAWETSPVYAHLPAEAVRADLSFSHDPDALFALPWFAPWFFAVRDVVPWLESWEQIESGTIVLPDSAKQERRERIVSEAVEALMPPEMRDRYRRRLEESADVLWRRDKAEAARIALYQALTLADNMPVAQVPFARALVRRTIDAAMEMVAAARQQQAQARR
jgi:hypothetical protein